MSQTSRVDARGYPPYADVVNLHVPRELEAKLSRPAAKTGCTIDQVALDLLAGAVAHDQWFRAQVTKGIGGL